MLARLCRRFFIASSKSLLEERFPEGLGLGASAREVVTTGRPSGSPETLLCLEESVIAVLTLVSISLALARGVVTTGGLYCSPKILVCLDESTLENDSLVSGAR